MDIILRNPADLIPYAANPNRHSDRQLGLIQRSIQQYGWTVPILVDEHDEVVAGHGRLEAATTLGLQEVPTIRLSGLTEKQITAYRIADNKLTQLSEWNKSQLGQEFADLLEMQDPNQDTLTTGFNAAEISQLIAALKQDTDPNEADDPPDDPITQLGDVWILGDHRLVCGDATDKDVVEAALDGNTPNLMVTDPPYGVEYKPAWRGKLAGAAEPSRNSEIKNDDKADWEDVYRLFPGNVAYVWHGALRIVDCGASIWRAGFQLNSYIVWIKNRIVISQGHYHHRTEPCIFATRRMKNDQWVGKSIENNLWFIDMITKERDESDEVETPHPTQKPMECMERPIRNHRGDVYEPFAGSGTTLIAAERQHRRCHAIELDPAYCDVVINRWENYTGAKAKRA